METRFFQREGVNGNSPCQSCEVGGKTNDARFVCLDCPANRSRFCQLCRSGHDMVVDKTHRVIAMSDYTRKSAAYPHSNFSCPRHAEGKLDVVCRECDQLLCSLCSVDSTCYCSEKPSKSRHKLIPLRERVIQAVKIAHTRKHDAKQLTGLLRTKKVMLTTQLEEVNTSIDNETERRIAEFRRHAETLKSEALNYMVPKIVQTDHHLNLIEMALHNRKSAVIAAERQLVRGIGTEQINTNSSLIAMLEGELPPIPDTTVLPALSLVPAHGGSRYSGGSAEVLGKVAWLPVVIFRVVHPLHVRKNCTEDSGVGGTTFGLSTTDTTMTEATTAATAESATSDAESGAGIEAVSASSTQSRTADAFRVQRAIACASFSTKSSTFILEAFGTEGLYILKEGGERKKVYDSTTWAVCVSDDGRSAYASGDSGTICKFSISAEEDLRKVAEVQIAGLENASTVYTGLSFSSGKLAACCSDSIIILNSSFVVLSTVVKGGHPSLPSTQSNRTGSPTREKFHDVTWGSKERDLFVTLGGSAGSGSNVASLEALESSARWKWRSGSMGGTSRLSYIAGLLYVAGTGGVRRLDPQNGKVVKEVICEGVAVGAVPHGPDVVVVSYKED